MLKMYGKTFPQSRSIAAYSTTPGAKLKYSGTEIDMHYPFPAPIERMREKLEQELGVRFNHVMLNRYDDGEVYIGSVAPSAYQFVGLMCRRHSDNLNNLVIASVSLGAERTFIMSPRLPAKNGKKKLNEDEERACEGRKTVKWKYVASWAGADTRLGNGSLVIMQGELAWQSQIKSVLTARPDARVLEGMHSVPPLIRAHCSMKYRKSPRSRRAESA